MVSYPGIWENPRKPSGANFNSKNAIIVKSDRQWADFSGILMAPTIPGNHGMTAMIQP
jgi:hypothetical protein